MRVKIIFLEPEEEKEIARNFRKEVKIEKILKKEEKDFCRWRFLRYFNKIKKELAIGKFFDSRLEKTKDFILGLKEIFISTNLYKGIKSAEGSGFKGGIILKFNLLYKDFKYAIIHESYHFLYHTKHKIERLKMEKEANTAALIISGISPYLWKFCSKYPFDTSLFSRDSKVLFRKMFSVRKIEAEEYLFLKERITIDNKSTYLKKIEKMSRKISKMILPNKILKLKFPLPLVFFPESYVHVYDNIYLPPLREGKII